jgi:hypothetical protein
MKKLLALTLSLASVGFVASSTEAKAAAAAPQVRVQIGQGRRYNRRVRVVNQTRLVRSGRQVYRETYQIRYLPNGRTQTRLISRVRVR